MFGRVSLLSSSRGWYAIDVLFILKTQHQEALARGHFSMPHVGVRDPSNKLPLAGAYHITHYNYTKSIIRKQKHISANTLRLWFKTLGPGVLMPLQESGIWSASSRSPSASVCPSWIWIITWFLEMNNLTKWFRSCACRTRTVVPRWLRPSKSFTDVSEVAQCCPKKKKKKSVSDTSQEAKSVQPMLNALGVCWILACTLWKVHSIKWVWEAQLLKECSSLLRCRTMHTASRL